jgi:hypothetical protein
VKNDSSERAPGAKSARRSILTHLKIAAWSALGGLPSIPDRAMSARAADGVTRVDVVVVPEAAIAAEMPLLGPLDLERRIWDVMLQEKKREPAKFVKTAMIARLVGHPRDTKFKYCLHFMVERGWLTYRPQHGYDLAIVPPAPGA